MDKMRETFTDYSQRKPEIAGEYIWRAKHRHYDFTVQFKAEMRERGANGERVLSFEGDYWDGWRVTVPDGLQWREAFPDDSDLLIEGLEVEKCAFCGGMPLIEGAGGFVTALPFQQPDLHITHCFASIRRSDWREAVSSWNTRPALNHKEPEDMRADQKELVVTLYDLPKEGIRITEPWLYPAIHIIPGKPSERSGDVERASSMIQTACKAMGLNLRTNHGTHEENAWQLAAQALSATAPSRVQLPSEDEAVEIMAKAYAEAVWECPNDTDVYGTGNSSRLSDGYVVNMRAAYRALLAAMGENDGLSMDNQ